MSFIGTLLAGFLYLPAPSLFGWVVWFLFLGSIVYALYQWRSYQPPMDGRFWGIFLALFLLVPLTNLFAGIRLPAETALPLPGIPSEPLPPAMMLFSALPWMLAAGSLGPVGAAVLGAFAGLLRGAWDTHNLFSILDLALLAGLFASNVRQRYRASLYGIIRQPLVSALMLIPLHVIIYILGTFLTVPGSPAVRLDYAISNMGVAALAFGGEVLVGGLVVQVLTSAFPAAWGRQLPLQPSPTEKSLEIRFLYGTGTFISLLLLTLLIGDWVVAGTAARNMLRERLASTAETAAQSVPFFLETGQNLASQLATDPRLLQSSDPELSLVLAQAMRSSPYFNQFIVLDVSNKTVLGGYPLESIGDFSLAPEEDAGLPIAASGVLIQIYTIPPAKAGSGAARVSFMAGIVDNGSGQVQRVLIGRTDLGTNPLTQPLISSLQSMESSSGTGMLIDDTGNILYHPNPGQVMNTPYSGARSAEASFNTETASDGTRQYIYYQPVQGRAWAVALTIPAWQAQQLALSIATPLSVMILILALVALVSLRIGLRVVTGSLQTLAVEANRIAQGKLDRPLLVEGVDEVGQLRRAFEQMRASLQARLDELNRLLTVSQGVASSLEMKDAIQPVLEAALATGASAARVVLSPAILPKTSIEMPTRFSLGPAAETFAHLDPQILNQTEQQDRIILPTLTRPRTLELAPNRSYPVSLLAVALRHENRYYGVLWTAYEQARTFSEADVRFVTTLAGQAALAAANAHLFMNVESSRRQLEAILHSTPDPVLVIDPQNRLMLANPAAGRVVGVELGKSEQSIETVIKQKTLLDLLQAPPGEKQSAEITFPGGRTYLATASSVMAEGQPVGRVCILRDVTHFKELDTMKSEFVATVSHDLRSPLTLMRGYATMLEMVGELNEQQQGYVRKIISGVENMSRLVNNLLDLGRIEIGVGLQVESVPIQDIIERVVGALQLQANQKNITLKVDSAKDLPVNIEADQALLHQGVYNLVENAIKYTPNGGVVTVTVRAAQQHLTFEIRDNGIGITPTDLPRLFEKFYRGKQREARSQHGTGLGLAIVRSIAERHGGKVWVESELGKGSAFFLLVPLKQPHTATSS